MTIRSVYPVKSATEFLAQSQSTVHFVHVGREHACPYVCVPASLCLPAAVAWPSLLSRSGQQVLGSCILAQLSLEAGPVCRVYVGHRERKRTQSNTPTLHHEVLPNAQKTLIYPGMMTKLNALDPSEEQ